MSGTGDTSHAALLRRRSGRIIAGNRKNNPINPSSSVGALDQATVTLSHVGSIKYTIRPELGPAIVEDPCCACVDRVSNLNVTLNSEGPFAPPYDGWASRYLVTWSAVPGASSYTVSCTSGYFANAIQRISDTAAYIYFSAVFLYLEVITVTAETSCGPVRGTYAFPPCFLAGSTVTMADGTTKAIEAVTVGEKVLGAFGEHNTVLALHRPLLGPAHMLKINDEHSTSAHHPHVGADKKIYSFNPAIVERALNNRKYPVINDKGETVTREFTGLRAGRLQKLTVGVELKTVEGARAVKSLKEYKLPADTQLYNLVLDGSHTYHVDSYAVTGWPREDDFDYDTWAPK